MLNQAGAQIQPMEVTDFSGGMTDNFIAAPANEFEKGDNLYINEYKKPITRPGLVVNDLANSRSALPKRINAQFDLNDQLFQISDLRVQYNDSGYVDVNGPSSHKALTSGDEYSIPSIAKWNGQAVITNSDYAKPVRLYKDGSTWKVFNVGLPRPAAGTVVGGTAGGTTTLFALVYRVQYQSLGVTYEEVGAVSEYISATNLVLNFNLSSIPTLANTATDNYDTANVKIDIYRTQANGTVFFFDGTIDNGVTTYSSTITDAGLALNDFLYSTSGRPDHEEPPPAKHVLFVNDVLFSGNVKEGGVAYPNRLRISNRFQPWSAPSSFYEDFKENITGLSAVGDNLIVFCESSTYLVSGYYFPDGSGGIQKRLISTNIGCISSQSIVSKDSFVLFAGNDGFYLTDGSQVKRVSEGLNYTYQAMTSTQNQKDRIYGTLDPVGNRVLFTVQESDVADDCDGVFVLHISFGVSSKMCFTRWNGGTEYASNFSPTSIYYFNGDIYHGDTRGYLLRYDESELADTKIDVAASPADWTTTAVIYDYSSSAMNFGSSSVKKWVPWIIVEAENASSVSLAIFSNNDNSGEYKALKEIKYLSNIAWEDYDVLWEDSIRWDYYPLLGSKRRFPAGSLRCSYKQIRMTNSFSDIVLESDLGAVTFSASAKTAVLDDISKEWPSDLGDYYIVIDSKLYKILSQALTTLTLEDIAGDLPDGPASWTVKGYRRGEILKLISYTINYSFTAQTQDTFRGSAT